VVSAFFKQCASDIEDTAGLPITWRYLQRKMMLLSASCLRNVRFEGTAQKLLAHGETILLQMRHTPKYIEHVRPA
jgi:hypothetical protein